MSLVRGPSGLEQRRQAQVGGEVAQRGSGASMESRASSMASAWPTARGVRVVARLAAVVHERPVARLDGEQLAGGAAARPSRSAVRARAPAAAAAPGAARPRPGRRPRASPRSPASCPRPSSTRPRGRCSGSCSRERLGQGERGATPSSSAPRTTSRSQSGPSAHQCPSSSVSIANTQRPGRPRSAAVRVEPLAHRGEEGRGVLGCRRSAASRVVGRRRRSTRAGSRCAESRWYSR